MDPGAIITNVKKNLCVTKQFFEVRFAAARIKFVMTHCNGNTGWRICPSSKTMNRVTQGLFLVFEYLHVYKHLEK
jgi:hypothetical protein